MPGATRACHHREDLTAFDLVLRGGLLVDGTGANARPADVGLLGDRILAVGDLSGVVDGDVATVLDVRGRIVAPGFIDPHGHSDGSVLVDGAVASHLHQGYTTQLSGNCGDTLAPITDAGRELVALALRPHALVARWRTFAEYLERVEEQRLGPNMAFLVGHGTVRASVLGADPRPPTDAELATMVGEVDAAMDAGAMGLSSGLIYAPGMHATAHEVGALVAASARHGGLYATHMRNECDDLFASLDESIDAIRAAGDGARLQVSHLKCASRSVFGRAGEAIERLEAARADGLDVAADQYPYTAASTSLATILPPALLGLGVEACVGGARRPGRPDRASGPRWPTGSRAGRTWPRTRAGRGSGSRSRRATRTGRAGRWRSSPTSSTSMPRSSRSMPSSTTGWTCRSCWTACATRTSTRSWPCPGSRSARTPKVVGPAIPSWMRACRIPAPTAARPACWATTRGIEGS